MSEEAMKPLCDINDIGVKRSGMIAMTRKHQKLL